MVATHLSRHTAIPIKLIVRQRDAYNDLAHQNQNITVEREGLQLHANALGLELLPTTRIYSPRLRTHPNITPEGMEALQQQDMSLQSQGPINSLFVATKAHSVFSALKRLLPRLTAHSTIVLLQNGGGLVETLVHKLFPDENLRPNFVVGINTHGANVRLSRAKGPDAAMHTVWAGIGDIKFGIMPNALTGKALVAMPKSNMNPLVNPQATAKLDLQHLPSSAETSSLRTTVAALLACDPLRPQWLTWQQVLPIQQQKIAVNAVINPLTVMYDCKNGMLRHPCFERMIMSICREASEVFLAQAQEILQHQPKLPQSRDFDQDTFSGDVDNEWIRDKGQFPPGHPLQSQMLFERTLQVMATTADNVSSMLADVRNGSKETEM